MFVLIVLFLIEIGGAISGYVLRNKMSDGLKEGMKKAVDTYYTDDDSRSAMDKVQESIIKCCGVNSYKDYFSNNSTSNTTKLTVPKSCCLNSDGKHCHYDNLRGYKESEMGIHLHGCYDELVDKSKKKFLIVGGVALGIAVFQILGVLCAYVLTKQFKDGSKYEHM